MSDRLTVKAGTTLIPFLTSQLQGWSRTTIKQRLRSGCVKVNGEQITRHDHDLRAGDQVVVEAAARGASGVRPQLGILYRDRDLVAINKPAGLLSVGSPKSKEPHALGMLRDQLSRRSKSIRLWPVHRIDRDTSGVLLFATSREVREAVMKGWKAAVTHFITERSAGQRTLLRVELETGRQHQIRAHLAWLGHPVVGDQRYGTAGTRMGLHALRLGITKPGTNKSLVFETPPPADFLALFR